MSHLGLSTRTRDLGPFYVSLLRYPDLGPAPLFDTGWTNTVEPPWMYGRCLVLRIWPSRWAISLGVWREHRMGVTPLKRISDEPSVRTLMAALDGHSMPEDVTAWDF